MAALQADGMNPGNPILYQLIENFWDRKEELSYRM
jgi:hypothetical protein